MKRSEKISKDAGWVAGFCFFLLMLAGICGAWVAAVGVKDGCGAVLLAAAALGAAIERAGECARLIRLAKVERNFEP